MTSLGSTPGVRRSDIHKRTGDPMKSIRKFAYAATLTLSALSFAPSLATAQAGGSFTLSHDVHWQKAVVPAGKYKFTVQPDGPARLLMLRKVGSHGANLLLMVTDVEESHPGDLSRLVVVSRPGGSFVQEMRLPEFGVTLQFAVPAETREMARVVATGAASAAR
jgi:hypothetical protein